MSKKKRGEDLAYHELPDLHPKLIRILIQTKVLSPSAHQVSLTIRDRFNSKGERERECFEGSSRNARRAGMGKKQFNKIADDLVELGLFRFGYRVFLNDANNSFKDFSTNEEAEGFRDQYEQSEMSIKAPAIVRLYKDVERLPTPEELGLTLIDKKNHIYFAPKNIRRTGKKIPLSVEEKCRTPKSKSSTPYTQESALNETNTNETNPNDTNAMVSNTKTLGEEAPASSSGDHNSTSLPSENLIQLVAAFEKRHQEETGRKVPSQQLRAVLEDESTKAAVEENISTILEAGGTFEGWVNSEYDRLRRNIDKKYRSPKLEYFGNKKSLDEYLDKLDASRLMQMINPFESVLNMEELRQCLSMAPKDDLTLIRYQILLRAYANSKSQPEVSAALELPQNYKNFFELEPKVFLYVAIKYLSFKNQRSKSVHILARQYANESGNISLISTLEDKRFKKLISKSKEYIQSHLVQ